MASNNKRARQQAAARRARLAAAAAAKRRRQRRTWTIGGVIALIAIVAVVVAALLANNGKSTTSTAATDTTAALPTSSTATTISAKGKPCVARADPLPTGAPDVPVQVGPPPTTLVKQDLKEGTGAAAGATDTVTVNYIGLSCSTGKIFDSSWSRSQTATFPLDQVIKGWTQGIPGMKVGGERLLGIPPDLAYGTNPPPGIDADETLWFVVDLVQTTPASATTTTTTPAAN